MLLQHRHNRRADTAEAHRVYLKIVPAFLPVPKRRTVPPAEPKPAGKLQQLPVPELPPVRTPESAQMSEQTMMLHQKLYLMTMSAPPHTTYMQAQIKAYKLFFSYYFTIVHFPVNVLPGSRTTCSDDMSPSRDPVAVTKTSFFAVILPFTFPFTSTRSAVISATTSAPVSTTRSLVASILPFTFPRIMNGFAKRMFPVKTISGSMTVSKASSSRSKRSVSFTSNIFLL